MTFHEYPKALYRKGDYMQVPDKAAEQAARAEGWTDYLTDRGEGEPVQTEDEQWEVAVKQAAVEFVKRKPGRHPKAK